MNVFLPTLNTALPNVLADLRESLAEHQEELFEALLCDSYVKSNGCEPKPANLAVEKHVALIKKVLNVDGKEYRESIDTIAEWFGTAIFHRDTEYVLLKGRWYARTWKKNVLKKPTAKQGVIFYKDWTSKHPTAGLAILTNKKNLRTLTHGMAVEKQTKQILHAANAHMTKHRHRADMTESDVDKLTEYYRKVEDQFNRDRGMKINEAVREIISESRVLLFCGPITEPDAKHYFKNGITEIQKRLRLACFQNRKGNALTMLECDARLLRSTYDENAEGHTAVAVGLAGILDVYTKVAKL